MDKNCQPSPPARTRRASHKHSAKQTSKLEQKIDSLVTLITNAGPASSACINATTSPTPQKDLAPPNQGVSPDATAMSSVDYPDSTHVGHMDDRRDLPRSAVTPVVTPPSELQLDRPYPTLSPTLEPTPQDAESYLQNFRDHFLKHLPFLVIPASVTAYQLRQERPILWLCIMTAASTDCTQQIGLSREVRGLLGHEAYVAGTRNMDFLLAVLVYVTW